MINNFFRKVLLCTSIILLLISSLSVVFVLAEASKYKLSLNYAGFQFLLSLFQPCLSIITTSIIVTTAHIAIETLKLNKSSEEGKALLDIRLLLNEKDNLEIHQNIRGGNGAWSKGIPKTIDEDRDIWRKIDNYLGTLELINILINKGVISLESFNNQFGYRVDNVSNNKDIMDYLNAYGEGNNVWKELYDLFKKRKNQEQSLT